jgi:hypothetical protein
MTASRSSGIIPARDRLGASAAWPRGEGVSLIRQGLAGLAETGSGIGISDHLARLSEA